MEKSKRKITALALCLALIGSALTPQTFAQVSVVGPSGTATAFIPQVLEFSFSRVVRMRAGVDNDPFASGTILPTPAFDFGTLQKVTDPLTGNFLFMRGEFFYYVLMIPSTSGRRYKITETGTQLTGPGGVLLPKESVLLLPEYQWLDQLGAIAQGAPPTGASVGPATSASNIDSLIYQSDLSGLSRLVRTVISIGGPPAGETLPFSFSLGFNGSVGQGAKQQFALWKPVPVDQAPGAYTGTITFTLVLD